MITDEQVETFLTAYGDSLARYDAAASAALWHVPGTMVGDGFVGVVSSREEMAEGLAGGYPLYRQVGLAAVGHTLVEHAPLTERVSRVRVRWSFLDADGVELTDSTYEYTLHADPRTDTDTDTDTDSDSDGHVLRAAVAVDIDASTKLAELLERHGIQPPSGD